MKRAKGGKVAHLRELAILAGAVENANEGFVTIDEHQQVLFFNRAAERIFGYSREEVVGESVEVILTPQCSKDHRRAVARYLRSREPRVIGHARELTAYRKSGESFPASISFSVSRVRGRVFFTAIVRDLTRTKELERKIHSGERLAALGQMVAEISHEIKNPLVVIGGLVRQLLKKVRDETALDWLGIMWSEVQRVESLLAQLGDLYRPITSKRELFDLNELLREIHTLACAAPKAECIQVKLELSSAQALVMGDKERLKQALLNVVKNGIEAMDGGKGILSITGTRKRERIEVAIADQGGGIPEEVLSRLFTPFFTTKSRGSGLGLCITKRIMEEHEGSSFDVVSETGKGTVVRFTLPLSGKVPAARKRQRGKQ